MLTPSTPPAAPTEPPQRYFNRELSWLDFNLRVLDEAMDESNPILERVKFLGIFHGNLDEFFMTRVSGLKAQASSRLPEQSPDGRSARQQLALIRERVLDLYARARRFFHGTLCPLLQKAGVRIYNWDELDEGQRAALSTYFHTTVYPILTPLAVDPAHPFPHISNLSINLAVVIRDLGGHERFARVKIPQVLPRLVPVIPPAIEDGSRYRLVWLEQVVGAHLFALFRGVTVESSYPFRVIRDADLEIREDEASDLLSTIEESLSQRRFGSVTRLSVTRDMPPHVLALLSRNLEIEPEGVYPVSDVLGLSDLLSLCDLELGDPTTKDPPFRPRTPPSMRPGVDLFASIRGRDVLLHHPYDSFTPVIEFLKAATTDPGVLAIKQTIYRVGQNSPIVAALLEAVEEGKQVAAMVELKARFDEEHNIVWARALEDAGVHVVYGDIRLKTHCKVLLVVRREPDGIRRYVHLGTGNYNVKSAAVYTDLGFFTCDPDIAEDVSALFNALTGYSINRGYRKLLVSPFGIRPGLIARIQREIEHVRSGRSGYIIFKMNALTDTAIIEELYRASQAGVKVDLIVRGICMLVPELPGLSENIRVISVVGRFLEHSRIFYFRNGERGAEEIFLGSADLMGRNLDRRVEILFPVEDTGHKAWLIELLLAYFRDTVKARILRPSGAYEKLRPLPQEAPFSVQEWLLPKEGETPLHDSTQERTLRDQD